MAYVPETTLDPMTFSASRIQTWISCNRKAGWQYIAGYEDPGTVDTEFGSVVHAILEAYKRDGVPIDMMTPEGACAAEALGHVEDFRADTGARFEGNFTVQRRHKWRGFKDISLPGQVVDYKTTSDFKWAKTAEQLAVDPQAILYAAHEMSQYDGPTVSLMWLYLRKKRPAALPVRVVLTRAEVAKRFEALERVADDFQAAAKAAEPMSLPERHRFVLETLKPNYDHCDAYRGCPHRDRCPSAPFFRDPSPQDPDQGPTAPMNDLLAKLEEMDSIAAAGGNPLAATAAEAPLQTMRGVPSPLVAAVQQPGTVPSLAFAPGGAHAGVLDGQTTFMPGFLDQPDAPPPANEGARDTQPAIPSALVATLPTLQMSEVGVTAEPNAVNPPKRRGRPPGAKNKASTDVPPAASLVTPLAAPAPEINGIPSVDITPPRPTGHRITTLYVGCAPHGFDAEALLVTDFDLLAAKAKVAIGPAVYYRDYGYKSNGHLLQMVEAVIQADRPEVVVVPYPAAPEAMLCLSHLRSISNTVVEALR